MKNYYKGEKIRVLDRYYFLVFIIIIYVLGIFCFVFGDCFNCVFVFFFEDDVGDFWNKLVEGIIVFLLFDLG